MLTDESGLSHTRAGLKLRQHHHHRDRGGSRASAKAAFKSGVSDTESESGPSHGESGFSDSSEDDAGDQRLDRDDAAAGSDEEDLWMSDEIGDLKLQKEAYERRLDLHKMELQRRPGMSRFTGHVGGINDGSVESARSWNPITSSWSSVASSERY